MSLYEPVSLDDLSFYRATHALPNKYNSMCGGEMVRELQLLIIAFVIQRLTFPFSLGAKVKEVWKYKIVFVILNISFKSYKCMSNPLSSF